MPNGPEIRRPCCRHCVYNHRQAIGEQACPFNALYWDFLARNYDRLKQNPGINLVTANLDRRDPADMEQIRKWAEAIRTSLRRGQRV